MKKCPKCDGKGVVVELLFNNPKTSIKYEKKFKLCECVKFYKYDN